MKKRTIVRKILLGVILLMTVAFVASHYDAREYSVHDEQEYLNRICEMTGVPSGIPEWTICLIPSGTQDNSDLYQVIERIRNIKLNHEPGKVHEYATINYDVLALIIEEVTGQKFEHYMKENVCLSHWECRTRFLEPIIHRVK